MPRGHILFSQEKDAKVIQGGGGWLPHSLSFMAMSFLPTQPSWEYASVAPWPPLPLGYPPNEAHCFPTSMGSDFSSIRGGEA